MPGKRRFDLLGYAGPVDAAEPLVEIFLRLNGYLTLSEWQIQAMNRSGQWETITDVDVLAVRFPGDVFLADSHDPEIQSTLRVEGELLMLEPDTIDVIVGEVKEGEAIFNAAITRHETLHTVLHRLKWLYPDGLAPVVSSLSSVGVARTRAPGGNWVRTRLVAFGRAPDVTVNTVPIGAILEQSAAFLAAHDDLLRSARFANPVAATLKLFHKVGLNVSRGS